MIMKLDNEFTVGVPIGEAWGVLTDLEMIAPCMPGAQLTGVNDGIYTGKVRIKVGPVTAEYAGTARFSEKDEETHRAVIDARGRDSRGNGNATAVISAQLLPEGESTRVTVSTDLTIAGRVAQFGSGMIKEVSAKLLGQFTDCLERRLGGAGDLTAAPASAPGTAASAPVAAAASAGQAATSSAGQAATAPAAASAAAASSAGPGTAAAGGTIAASTAEPAALDLMSVAGGAIYKRLVPVVAGLVVLGVVIWLIVR
jgi:carbon monoxide dehydrogenase subunit G